MSARKGELNDLIADIDHHKSNCWSIYLDLKKWRDFNSTYPLRWSRFRFEIKNKGLIPKERGIYAFSIALEPSSLPEHGYILYMGITGDDSGGNLYKRYNQYLGYFKRKDGRPKVYNMLKRWEGDLFFSFVPIPDKRMSLSKLETEFLTAIRPPVNEKDFEARISNARRAAF
ncbi:Uncharacterised protein [Klebsiella variicola]|uniref:hypothetical protein n=1 Tax=Klebsiella variicola TaxID=244366 RepID=UPI000F6B343E|nr:hypothetical protein [Klebsiella variicola]MBZ7534015.1 hypothetical protein [Klebsiella variicola]MCK6051107.1 hypothetical protein [Klebsiella variicola]VEC96683.1 Uncharacterised protein [Klebsiella variicola]HCJ0624841.1 hypothetical protein [Klebsiella variicola]HCU0496239.1 hypothetical protein [Klebsiella variicola]